MNSLVKRIANNTIKTTVEFDNPKEAESTVTTDKYSSCIAEVEAVQLLKQQVGYSVACFPSDVSVICRSGS